MLFRSLRGGRRGGALARPTPRRPAHHDGAARPDRPRRTVDAAVSARLPADRHRAPLRDPDHGPDAVPVVRLMSTFHGMFSVGTLIGGILGGIFSQWKVTPLQQALALAVIFFIIAIAVKPLFFPADADKHDFSSGPRAKHPFIFWILGFFGLFAAISEGAAGDWGGVLARDAFSATPFVSTLPYIVFCSAMIIGRFSGDYLAHRFGASLVIASGGIISGTGLTVGLIVGGIPAIMVSWFLLGIGLSVVIPLMFSAAGTLATKKYAGIIAPSEAVAKVSGVSYFGFVIGPPLIGFIADAIELRWTLFLIAAFSYLLIFASRYAREA